MPQLSILIANWNVRELLQECLEAVAEQMLLPVEDYEIIVVDNASTDGSVEMLKESFSHVAVIENDRNVGFGSANNQAFEASAGRYIVLLNTDAVICDHAIDRMMDWMDSQPDVGAAGCRLVNPDGSFQRGTTGGAFLGLVNVACSQLFVDRLLPKALRPRPIWLEGDPEGDLEVDWVHAACMLLRREAIPDDMFFDERFFMYGEDMDLCWRLRQGAWRIVYTSCATVMHYGHGADGKSPLHELRELTGIRTYFALRYGRVRRFLHDGLLVAGYGVRWIMHAVVATARPGRGHRKRAAERRRSFSFALRLMFGVRIATDW